MAVHLPENEQEQILQTIEMFEVIVQANPDDYQSLDLLREAYGRLGRSDDARRAGLQKAEACLRLGQHDEAHESIQAVLAVDPDCGQAAQLAAQLSGLGYQPPASPAPPVLANDPIDLDFSAFASEDTSLTELPRGDGAQASLDFAQIDLPETDGNDPLAEFLRDNHLVPDETLDSALAAVRETNAVFSPERVAASLLGEVFRLGTQEDEETILLKILNHTKLGFAPLECYDVDRQIAKMLPAEVTLGRLILPFDLISRTLLIAMANPFDHEGREVCKSLLDYNIQWYFAHPGGIVHSLAGAYRMKIPPTTNTQP